MLYARQLERGGPTRCRVGDDACVRATAPALEGRSRGDVLAGRYLSHNRRTGQLETAAMSETKAMQCKVGAREDEMLGRAADQACRVVSCRVHSVSSRRRRV